MGDAVCCWTHCDNPAGAGTHTQIDVPQINAGPMVLTAPVCEEHWYGSWRAERIRLEAEVARLRGRLGQIAALASGESA